MEAADAKQVIAALRSTGHLPVSSEPASSRVDVAELWRRLSRAAATCKSAPTASRAIRRLQLPCRRPRPARRGWLAFYQHLSLIHISEPTRLLSISYAVFC